MIFPLLITFIFSFFFRPRHEYPTVSLHMACVSAWRHSTWPCTLRRLPIKYRTCSGAPNSIPSPIWPYLTCPVYRNSHVSGRSPHGRRGMLQGVREEGEGGKVGRERGKKGGKGGSPGILVLVASGIFKDIWKGWLAFLLLLLVW